MKKNYFSKFQNTCNPLRLTRIISYPITAPGAPRTALHATLARNLKSTFLYGSFDILFDTSRVVQN